MKKTISSVRGMQDILPAATSTWRTIFNAIYKIADSYGYQEIILPILEHAQLYLRGVGQVTDIVSKELYYLEDRNKDLLVLRPECTAGCVRAAIEHGLLRQSSQRLWYCGPMFRHERPQLGRYREFNQFGVECFGVEHPIADVEVIQMAWDMLRALNLASKVKIEINSLGSFASREAYKNILVEYFNKHQAKLDQETLERLAKNPLRILDSKKEHLQEIISAAPKIIEHLDAESQQRFDLLQQYLRELKIPYTINPNLVRGLDYYCHTVFEFKTTELGAQDAIGAGGRYDGLVEQLGGKSTPAVGFSIGLERVMLLSEQSANCYDLYIVYDESVASQALLLAADLRDKYRDLKIVFNIAQGSYKSQLKKAHKANANLALILGKDEVAQDKVTIKFLQEDKEQLQLSTVELYNFLQKYQEN